MNMLVIFFYFSEEPDDLAPSTSAGVGDGAPSNIKASYNPVSVLILFDGQVGIFVGDTEGNDCSVMVSISHSVSVMSSRRV